MTARLHPFRQNLALLLPVALLALAGCDGAPQTASAQKGPPPAPQVTVAKPVKRTVVDMDEYVGRFVSVNSVEIRARVSGYLEKVHFTDGQVVKAGDLLFSIDPRPFRNSLEQARSVLEQARASLAFSESDFGRADRLIREKSISEQQYEQRVLAKRNAEAQVAANEAAVKQAELDLQFTELRAPIGGRIGDRRVAPGNLVIGGSQSSTTLLATIVTVDPIRFEFTFDEAAYLRYLRLQGEGMRPFARGTPTRVSLRLLDEPDFVHEGTIDFVDNVIDQSSGTIRGRAEFRNPGGLFTPGMFARLRMPASPPLQALLLPDSAIGTEQVRKFVYTVDGENTVQQKYVTLGQLDGGLRVIRSGVSENDRVIISGLLRARPGGKVDPQEGSASPADGPAAPGAPRAAK